MGLKSFSGARSVVSVNATELRASPAPMLSPRLEAILVGLLVVATLIWFANMLTNSFVYDDEQQILQNPYIKSWRFLPEIMGSTVWSFVGEVGLTNYYRPLMTLSFLALWTIFGPVPFGFHLFSLALHAAVVVMVFYAGRQLFADWRVASLAALFFAIHPVHTEAVDWISAYPDLEMALLFLAAFYLYTRSGTPDWKHSIALVAIFTLALLSKEPALMLLPVVILFEYVVRVDHRTIQPRQKILRYLPLIMTGVAYLLLRITLFGKLAPVLQHPQISWHESIYSAFALVAAYLKLLVWPSPLSAFHVFHPSNSLADIRVAIGIIILPISMCAIILLRRKKPEVAFCLFWIGITLLPVLNARWMAANVLTERYLYLPSVGFCWLAAWLIVRVSDLSASSTASSFKPIRPVLAAGLVVLSLFGIKETVARNRVWRDDHTLYARTLETDPHAYPILLNLGLWYHQRGELQEAENEYKLALLERPDGVNILNNLGVLYSEQNRNAEASGMLTQAIAVKPLWADPHFNYGRLLDKQGCHERALAELRTATQLAPVNPLAHRFYADALALSGSLHEATSEYELSLTLGPSLEAQRGLADAYARAAKYEAAEALLRRMTAENPYDSFSHLSIARLLEHDGKLKEAYTEYRKVLDTDPHNQEARSAIIRLREGDRSPTS
jgi:tetratricopeptide (TPR) repeat protein